MLTVRLEATGGREKQSFRPVERLRIQRDAVEIPGESQAITYQDGFWRTGDSSYLLLRIEGRTWVHFSSAGARSAEFGPFDLVCVLAGVVRVGSGESQHLAQRYDQSGSWRIVGEQDLWTTAVFSASAHDEEA